MSQSHSDLAARGAAVEYWTEKLRDIEPLGLPRTRRGGAPVEHSFAIPDTVAAAVRAAAGGSDLSAYLLHLTAYVALLWRYGEGDDVVVRAASAFFRQQLDADATFRTLLQSLRDQMEWNLRHGGWDGDGLDPAVLLQAAFSDDRVSPPEAMTERTAIHLHMTGAGRGATATVRCDLGAAQFFRHYVAMLNGVVTSPDAAIATFPMLGNDEVAELLAAAGSGPIAATSDDDLVTRFERAAAATPDAVALTCDGRHITYRELDERANGLAADLAAKGVADGDVVAILLDRTEWLVIAVVGILKAGATYLPIDPSYPEARVKHMLADSGAKLLLESVTTAARTAAPPHRAQSADRVAYIIYTSGSTGVPKGVAVTHRNVVRLFESTAAEYRFGRDDVWTFFHSAAFDFSVWEMWGALLHGGRLVVVPSETAKIAEDFHELVARERVTVLNQTPSAFRHFDLADAAQPRPLALRLVIFGGEALDLPSLRGWFDRHGDASPRLVNMYGITETTVFVTWRPLSLADLQSPSLIGRAIPGWEVHLLDRHGNLVPRGVTGEIYVGGHGVAQGYLNRPDLNAERFVPSPFVSGTTLYRSGDLARRLADGDLEYLGRADQQVKVRGFRIELAEIEQCLLEHPSIDDAAVLAVGSGSEIELVAFLFGAPEVRARELRDLLRRSLPAYMVPARFIAVPEQPRTSNGKLDRRALLALAAPSLPVAAPTLLEASLRAIWSDVLRRDVALGASFFDLGGHSLKAARLIGRIRRELSVDVSLADLFRAPTVAALARLIETRGASAFPPIEPLPAASSYELSDAQRRLWVIDQFDDAVAAYNVPAAFWLDGEIDSGALEAALHDVVLRHESLRTRFVVVDGEPRQIIGAADPGMQVRDAAGEEEARRLAHAEAVRRFDLGSDPLLRLTLVRIAPAKHLLVFVAHHIICDARSLEVFARDLAEAYARRRRGDLEPLQALRVHYADFAAWQRRLLGGAALDEHRAYWHQLLAGDLPRVQLPTDFPRPAVRGYRGATATFRLGAPAARTLDALARALGLTPALLALVNVLLFRLTGDDDIVVGHTVTGRTDPDLDEQIGLYVNTLPLRMQLRGDASLQEVVVEAALLFAEGFDHQAYPFDRLVEELCVARDTGRSPLFDVLVVVNDAAAALTLDGVCVTPVPLDNGTSKFDLSFYFTEEDGDFSCAIEYDTALFRPSTIVRWWRCFERLLEAQPADAIDAIDIVPRDERAELLSFRSAVGEETTLVELFERQVDAAPDAIAVAPAVSYRELDERANRVANALIAAGLAPGARVALCLDRSADLIAAILGVLKSGAAYVPLDPSYPEARTRLIVSDSGASAVIDEQWIRLARRAPADRPRIATMPCQPAYVIYTSGSTGEPKGVVVAQRSVLNVIRALPLGVPRRRVALVASAGFDVSVHQLFAALLAGHELHVISESMKRDPSRLVRYFEEHDIDASDCTPTLLAMLLDSSLATSRTPRHLIVAGEALPRTLVERLRATRITNAYGPTEACVYATSFEIEPDRPFAGAYVPIGAPLANVEILVLDDALRLLPRGCVGEICIGGAGLALGYLNREALTAERFVPHPFRAGERLYRTGDYGRWSASGALEYHGRRDAQVKVRGHRIELAEVEAVLRRLAGVRDAVAITIGDGIDRDLAAYVAVPSSLDAAAIKDQLRALVPDFLIPSRIAVVDALPIGPTGKVDRKALPPLDDVIQPGDEARPPTPLERSVAEAWAAVLGRDDIGIHTDFFAAGGQSLKAVQLLARLRESTGRALTLSDIFRFPTVEGQARRLAAAAEALTLPIEPLPPAALYDCSSTQRRIYFTDRIDESGAAYQMPGLFRIDGAIDERLLREACRRVVLRHESLRTTFTLVDGEPKQCIAARADVRIAVFDEQVDPDDADACRALIARDVARRFDLERGPLWRIALYETSGGRLLLFNMHHLIGDGWSLDVLMREVAEAYEALRDGGEPAWTPLPVQYKDYAAWQQRRLDSGMLDGSAAYWRGQLAPPLATLDLPSDRPRPAVRSFAGRIAHGRLQASLVDRLGAIAAAHGTTLFAALLTAVKVVLFRAAKQEEIVVGTPVAGRGRPELEGQIGLYLDTVVLRDRLRATDTLAQALRAVGATVAAAMEHEYPFDRLVGDLSVPRDRSRSPLFDVLVAMQEHPAVELRLGAALVRELPHRNEVSKLDLGFHFVPQHDGSIALDLEYATALFDASRIERLVAELINTCERIAADPQAPLAALADDEPLGDLLVEVWRAVLKEDDVATGDDFFELGGDSLKAMRLLARVERDFGLRIALGDFLRNPTIDAMVVMAAPAAAIDAIVPLPPAADYELSAAQKRLWLLDSIDTIGTAYNIAAAFDVDGDVDDAALETALRTLFARHEVLRTRIVTVDDAPRQRIVDGDLPLRFADVDANEVNAELLDELAHRFDLANEPLFRALVLRVRGTSRRVVILHLHHIVADAQSANVLLAELEQLYAGATLAPLSIQYKDSVPWLRAASARDAADREYWLKKLEPPVAALDLPADFSRPAARNFAGALVRHTIPAGMAASLRELARERGVTLFTLFVAAVKALLHRLTGEEDIVIGTPVSGRPHPALERQVGLFLDTVVLRDRVRAGEPLLDLLDHVRETMAEAFSHQRYPFDLLIGDLALGRDTSRSPLFDVMVVHHAGEQTHFRLGSAEARLRPLPARSSKFDLSVHVTEGDVIEIEIEYATELFSEARMTRFAGHLETLLRDIANDPSRTVGELDLLRADEREHLLVMLNRTEPLVPVDVVAKFEAEADRAPEAPCIVFGARTLTFGEVRRRADGLAGALAAHVRPGGVVGVVLERGDDVPVVLLATLKAGGVYAYLDPHLPPARFELLVRDCQPSAFIADADHAASLLQFERPVVDCRVVESAAPLNVAPPDAAYIVYTSGSTGEPKGVLATRRCVDNLIGWQEREIGRGLRSMQFAALGFDVAIQEILFSLATGGTLFVPDDTERRDPSAFLRRHGIEMVTMPFAALNAWFAGSAPETIASLKHVITSGEQLHVTDDIRRFLAARPDVALHNQYGPSETHVVTSHTIRTGNVEALPPIGRPIANTRAYIVDQRLDPVPLGVPGELLIGGDNVALGYLGRADLTAARFIQFAGERVYRTGDVARWRDFGAIEFLGRRDDQAKIRGFRVEPGEIEQTLRRHPAVREAAVITVGENGARELCAYVTGEAIDCDELRRYLAHLLPDYMVPAYIVAAADLPRTSTGKLDRAALPAPAVERGRGAYVSARTALESRLVALWEAILERAPLGIDDDFFANGGDSLAATRLSARIAREFGLSVGLADVFVHPTVAAMAAHLAEAAPSAAAIEPVPPAGHYAVSHAQLRMWMLEHLAGEGSAYTVPGAIRIRGTLDVGALERAFNTVTNAHEAFRTTFVVEDGEPRQRIADSIALHVGVVECDGEAAALDVVRREMAAPFDLAAGPLFRATLIRFATDESLLFVNMHHTVTDGWSLELSLRQLLSAYEAELAGEPLELPPPRVTYKDYAAWQRRLLDSGIFDADRDYWRRQLDGLEPLTLPTDYPRPVRQSFAGRTLDFAFSPEMTHAVESLAAAHDVSVFLALLAAVKALFHRMTAQEEFAVGTIVAGRTHPDLHDVVGCFVNSVVLRDRVDAGESFARLLDRVRRTALDAYEHQAYPFDRLVEEIAARDASRSPLFDVIVAMQNEAPLDLTLGGTSFREETLPLDVAKVDLTIVFHVAAGVLHVVIQYATSLFTEETIGRMAAHLEALLRSAAANPALPLRDLAMVDDDERRLLEGLSRGPVLAVERVTIVDAFERAADSWPDAAAVVAGDGALTYRDLDARANAIAHWLRDECGVERDARVALRTGRGVDLIAGMIGILKSGAAYVPIEPSFPAARAAAVIADAQCAAIVDEEAIARAVARHPATRPHAAIGPDDLAYVLYTSGSTGAPKGVMIQHDSVVNLAATVQAIAYDAHPLNVALVGSIVFDITVQQMFPALFGGHVLHVLGDDAKRDADALARWVEEHAIDVCDATPGLFSVMLEGGLAAAARTPRAFLVGGEPWPTALSERYWAQGRNRHTRIINLYGPTECCVENTGYELSPDAPSPMPHAPVGRPLPNQDVWILDEARALLPFGAVGEIWIGGRGLARGYLGRDDLTAERFLPHPFDPGERIYRTGDFGRWRNDRVIEFLGRRDGQVKVRGHRIECAEIEAALRRCSGVRDAAIVLRDRELAAYVAGDVANVRAELESLVPAYMIPAWIVAVDTIPLTPSGKVDRRALPEPPRDQQRIAPATDAERRIAAIWEEVLGVDSIGVTDDFFAAGGNSIRAIQVVSRMRRDLHLGVTVADLFTRPTVRSIAASSLPAFSLDAIPRVADADHYALSPAQRRLWVIERMVGRTAMYNVPAALRIRGPFDDAAFRRAVDAVVARHESLRTRIAVIDGVARQVIDPTDAVPILATECFELFDLERDRLFRVAVLHPAAGETIVLFNAHHIVVDGWSIDIIVRDLFAYYRAFTGGAPYDPSPLALRYRDFAQWQNASLAALAEARRWWVERLAPPIAALELPSDRPRPAVRTYAGATASFVIDAPLARAIDDLGRAHGATLFTTLLALVKVLLHRYTGTTDIVVGTPVAGRIHPQIEGMVGLFVNTIALRAEVRPDAGFAGFLRDVTANVAEALERQVVPFDAFVDELRLERDPSRNALFDVLVSLHDHGMAAIEIPGAVVEPLDPGTATSKFDLSFTFVPRRGAIELHVEYSTELFDSPRIERMFVHLRQLCESAVATPEAKIGALEIAPPAERARLLAFASSASPASTVIDLFETVAARCPDDVAVVCEGRQLTYRDLDETATRIAALLRRRGCVAESRVALRASRSEMLIAAMVAVLKCGAAYVPIDAQWPEERARLVLDDCGCTAVLDDETILVALAEPPAAVLRTCGPRNLAYVLYTSGSTGVPKGVMVEHHSLANIAALADAWQAQSNVAVLASVAFDVSGVQIWGALTRGHTLHVIPDELKRDAAALVGALGAARVDVADCTPGLMAILLEGGLGEPVWRPRHLLAAGEALPASLVQRLHRRTRETRVENLYGPTEACVYATGYAVDPGDLPRDSVPIGVPLPNQHIVLLDERLQLVPFGCDGEICIGGEGVARGYWDRDALTAERFPAHPFREGERIYRTGDYGRWREDGNLEFLGRRDAQVKLRGYRIELGEIETALLRHDVVENAAAILRDGLEINAFVVARRGVDAAELRNALARTLPPYMLPARFLCVDALPLSSSGKVDRRALAAMDGRELRGGYTAPQSGAERDLAAAWQEVLGRDAIGVDDNYFHLGGDSIRAIQIAARLAERGWRLDVRTIFRFPTIAALAPHLEPLQAVAGVPVTDRAPLLPAQAWFFDAPGPEPNHFNQALLLHLRERLDEATVVDALAQLLARHEALRSRFDGAWRIEDAGESPAFAFADLRGCDDAAARLTAAAESAQRGLDIARGPLMQARLFRLDDGDRLLLVIHHLVVDGISWRILLDDFHRICAGAALAPRSESVQAWSHALHAWGEREELRAQLPFWQRIESAAVDEPPHDVDGAHGNAGDACRLVVELGVAETSAIEKINAASRTHFGDVLLAALSIACDRWFGGRTLRVSVEAHGRERFGPPLDVSSTVGWFTSIFPLLLELKRPGDAAYTLRWTKEALRQVPAGGIGYGVLRYLSRAPLGNGEPRVVVNFLGHADGDFAEEPIGPSISPRAPMRHDLALVGVVAGGRLRVEIEYDAALYAPATIAHFARCFEEALRLLNAQCETAVQPTPSDFTYADGIALHELDELFVEGEAQ